MLKLLFAALTAFIISGCAYTTGTEVKPQALDQIKVNKSTKSDVEKIVGYPPRKQAFGSGEIWYYDYQAIGYIPFTGNTNETTVFEFNSKGVVTKKYKANKAGNPLTD